MYIYKIQNKINQKCYIGLSIGDSKNPSRMNSHKKSRNTKISRAIKEFGKENFTFEIIHETDELCDLIFSEIENIEKFNSYLDGYNGSPGGEFNFPLESISNSNDLDFLRNSLSKKFKDMWAQLSEEQRISKLRGFAKWNIERWINTTVEQRLEMVQHLYTSEVLEKRSKTVKKKWDNMTEEERLFQSRGTREKWSNANEEEYEKLCQISRNNGKKAAKPIRLKNLETGIETIYDSGLEGQRQTGLNVFYIKKVTGTGSSYKGFQAWSV